MLTTAVLLAGLVTTATEPEPRVLAVFPLDPSGVVSAGDARELTSALETDLVGTRRFVVIAASDLRAALQKQKAESYRDCFDEKCQIEIGRELAAQLTLSAKVLKLDESCEVTLKLYDLRQAASNEAANASDECTKAGLRRALRAASFRLAGVAPAKQNSAIRFDAPELPVITVPDAPAAGVLSIDDIDVDALEAYDAALRAEKQSPPRPEEILQAWAQVKKKSRKLAPLASERTAQWKRYAAESKRAAARAREVEKKRTEHFKKLKRLLELDVASAQDKQDWAVAFIEAYGTEGNPYAADPLVRDYLAKAAWAELEREPAADAAARLARVEAFVARYPEHAPALELRDKLAGEKLTEERAQRARDAAKRLPGLIRAKFRDPKQPKYFIELEGKAELDRCVVTLVKRSFRLPPNAQVPTPGGKPPHLVGTTVVVAEGSRFHVHSQDGYIKVSSSHYEGGKYAERVRVEFGLEPPMTLQLAAHGELARAPPEVWNLDALQTAFGAITEHCTQRPAASAPAVASLPLIFR